MLKPSITALAIVLAGTVPQAAAQAADTAFFEGKNLTYIVATNAGGGFDAYGRLIGKYMEEKLEADNVLISNIPGAGHIVGTNTLWEAKPDGLTIGTFDTGLMYVQLLGKDDQRFNMKEFEYIGKAAGEPRTLIVSTNCDVKTVDGLLNAEQPIKFSGAGVGSSSYTDIQLLAEALDLNVQTITGYDGTEGEMAMMRGEICAQIGSASSFREFVKAGHANYLISIGGDVDGAENAMDLAETEKSKKIIELMATMAQLGRITAAPPETPQDRVAALRSAYRQALEDPELLAEAKKMRRPIQPAFGEDVQKLVQSALDQSPEIVDIISSAMTAKAD